MWIAISVSSFIFAASSFMAIYLIINSRKAAVILRMKRYIDFHSQLDTDIFEKPEEKLCVYDFLGILGKAFKTRSFTKRVESELLKAEILMRGEEFIVLNLVICAFSFIIGFIITGYAALSIIFSLVSLIIPAFVVKRKKRARLDKINKNISDCLTVISNSLRAGYSFQQAIDLVGKETGGPLAAEFRKTAREINLGTTIEEALNNLNERSESDDLGLMITAVLIQRQIGGNLAEILDNISFTIRERIRIKGEIKTLTAQGRISGMIIGFMPPVLFFILMIINPSYMMILIENRVGLIILGGSILSELLGAALIKKVLKIET